MKRSILLSLGVLVTLVGCKPPALYEWGNYEGSLYTLMKDPTSFEQYGKALSRQIEDGERSGRVPPGIYAEYGYFLSVTNHPVDAIKFYEKEKQRWPESALLMDKMILSEKGPKPARTASAPAAAAAPGAVPVVQPATSPASGGPVPLPASAPNAVPAPVKEHR
jgi:hypothetical protein